MARRYPYALLAAFILTVGGLTACGGSGATTMGAEDSDPNTLLTPAPPQNNPDNIVPFPSFPSFPYPAYTYLVGMDPTPHYLLGVFNLEQEQCILTDPTGLPLPDQHKVESYHMVSLTTAWTPADILVHCETGPENATLNFENGQVTAATQTATLSLSYDAATQQALAIPDAAIQEHIYNKEVVLLRAVYQIDGSARVDRLLVYDPQVEGFYIPGNYGNPGLAALHIEVVQFVIPTNFNSVFLQSAQTLGDL